MIDYNPKDHIKITYHGNSEMLRGIPLFVIIDADYPMALLPSSSDKFVVIHRLNKWNQVIVNTDEYLVKEFTVRASEIQRTQINYRPSEWN